MSWILRATALSFCFLFGFVEAIDISRDCYEKVPERFFSRDTVIRALQLYNVYQNQWYVIVDDLHNFGRNIPATVRKQARALPRDPYTPPEQPDVIKELFLAELEKLFKSVLLTHNIQYNLIDNEKIHQMFLYILQNNGDVFDLCIKSTERPRLTRRSEGSKAPQ